MKFVLLLLILWSGPTLAVQDCSTIEDVSKDLGPVWDQVDTSWCHVFTTADVMSQHLLNEGKLKKGERLHPLRIAVAIAQSNGESVRNSLGTPSTFVSDFHAVTKSMIEDSPLCLESQLESVKGRANVLLNEKWQFANKLFSGGPNAKCAQAPPIQPALKADPDSVANICDVLLQQEYKFWHLTFNEKCKGPPNYWMNYHYWFRKERFNGPGPLKRTDEDKGFEEESEARITDALKKHELAAIGYDASFIRSHPLSGSDSHWSSIVGRFRGKDGMCYYRVRNSWGPDCKGYNSIAHCEKGYLNVPANELLRHIHTVQYITGSTPPSPIPVEATGTSQ